MIFGSDDVIRNVTWLQPADEQRIMDFLQAAVYIAASNFTFSAICGRMSLRNPKNPHLVLNLELLFAANTLLRKRSG
jgi:FtsZ-interacting cell division protein YlmF